MSTSDVDLGLSSKNGKRAYRMPAPFNPGYNPLGPISKTPFVRALTQDERYVVQKYLDYYKENGTIPFNRDSVAFVNEDLPRGQKFSAQKIRSMFKGLLELNVDPGFSDVLARMTGFRAVGFSKQECAYALRFYIEFESSKLPNGNVFVPARGDIDAISLEGAILAKLGTPIPNSAQMCTAFGTKSWSDVLHAVAPEHASDIRKKIRFSPTLKDVIRDYQLAFVYFGGLISEPGDLIITPAMIDEYSGERGGLGFPRYRTVMRKYKKDNGKPLTLNAIRKMARLPYREDISRLRYGKNLNETDTALGFISAWNLDGKDGPAPTNKRLKEINRIQMEIINEYGHLDGQAAQEAKVPAIKVPTSETIRTHFDTLPNFLEVLERTFGQDLSTWRDLSRFAQSKRASESRGT